MKAIIPSPTELDQWQWQIKHGKIDTARIHNLFSEIRRLRAIVEATNPCPSCGVLHLVEKVEE